MTRTAPPPARRPLPSNLRLATTAAATLEEDQVTTQPDHQDAAVPRPATLPTGGACVGDSFEIMALFEPDGGRIDEITISLWRLARAIRGSEQDARQAVLLLLRERDFDASIDVETAPGHKVFRLRRDWTLFDQERLSINGHAGASETCADTTP